MSNENDLAFYWKIRLQLRADGKKLWAENEELTILLKHVKGDLTFS